MRHEGSSGRRSKKRKTQFIQDPKLRGEWVESVFMARAGELGFEVSRPWGDSKSYDFVIGGPGNFASVQVKSTVFQSGSGYECGITGPKNEPYPPGSFDFIAAYVVLEDAWYILPASRVQGLQTVCLSSKSKVARYEVYLEAWQLLRKASEVNRPEANHAEVNRAESGAEQIPTAEQTAFPQTGAVGRMQAAGNYFRRYLERSSVVPQKVEDKS
jgi:hypothetical protein